MWFFCLALILGCAAGEYSEVRVVQEVDNFLESPHYLKNDEIGDSSASWPRITPTWHRPIQ
ncbi:GM19070 [Drosophila sechellia]|uniref:GM19070 n=1 Tax=Drosophila sechellia TaxID=7238 RepID=B4I928_DROSE|nr:GM19070 [Drosophila sechellia]